MCHDDRGLADHLLETFSNEDADMSKRTDHFSVVYSLRSLGTHYCDLRALERVASGQHVSHARIRQHWLIRRLMPVGARVWVALLFIDN